MDPQALTLQWAFGFSSTINNGVAVVSETGQNKICYVAAHTAVIYDWIERQQLVLQGHCNRITCLGVTEDKSCIITADAGEDAMVVVWESATGQPLRTINNPHPAGVAAMDISPSGHMVVIVSAPSPYETQDGTMAGSEQEISLWDLSDQGSLETPSAVGNIPAGDLQNCVRFSKDDPSEILSNGKQRVYFWKTQLPYSREFKYYSPPVSARDFKQAIGDFTVSVFVPGTTMAVTGTVDGDVVVWEEGSPLAEPSARPSDRRAVKILRIHLEASITALTVVDRFIVSGGSDGCIRFYDAKLRLAAWFDELKSGPVMSISFASAKAPMMWEVEDAERFNAPDFVVGTSSARVVAVKSQAFERIEMPRGGEQVMEGIFGRVDALAAHPMRPEFCCTGAQGVLWVWNYSTKQLVRTREFETLRVCNLKYSPDGALLAAGCTNGTLRLLNPNTLEDVQAFRFTTGCCLQVAFSPDCQTVAQADAAGFVGIVTFGHGRMKDKWEFIGKHGTHCAAITGLCFQGLGKGTTLYSLGADGRLVEYDLANSSIGAGLRLVQHTNVGRGAAIPSALAVAPPTVKSTSGGPVLITVDNGYKFKVYEASSQLCIKTVLGPTYGGPLNSLQVFQPAGVSDSYYLAYSTSEKVIGLSAFPLTGDPRQAMGLIAHPGEISAMAVTYDGRRLLTVGADDSIVNMWQIDVGVLDNAAAQASNPLHCYMSLLEGGPEGDFYQEIKDYFYYTIINSQGEETTAPRQIDGKVLLSVVPNLMRALGYYPSEAEVADMIVELQRETADKTDGGPLTHIDFERFLALYTNHRPVFGIGKDQLQAAFASMGSDPVLGTLNSMDLINSILEEGESLSQTELEDCLHALKSAEVADDPEANVYDIIPPHVDAKQFAEDVLGFEDYS